MSTESVEDKPLHALEEQLARQKGILANRALLQRLPDKGDRIQASMVRLEEEVEKRRQEAVTKRAQMTPKDVEEMEWALGSISFLQSELSKFPQESKRPQPRDSDDSDDDKWEDANDEDAGSSNPLKIIATSQISQRQPKTVIDNSSGEPQTASDSFKGGGDFDRFSTRIVKKDSKKSKEDTKFVPSKISKTKALGSSSPAGSTSSASSNAAKQGEGSKKWDEALLPPNLSFDSAKLLSMEDTINIGSEKCKEIEALKSLAPRKKVYAYDKLKEQGLLGSYTVQMQTTRPVQTDVENDDFEDLSDDQITEESDSDDVDNDQSANQKTSEDLCKIVNSSLKLK